MTSTKMTRPVALTPNFDRIPAALRGLHFHQLWHFFAPYVPIEILVPEAQGWAATELLDPLLGG